MTNATIAYRLPVSEVVIDGVLSRTRDLLEGPMEWAVVPAVLAALTVSVETRADDVQHTVTIMSSGLRSFTGTFGFTPDGRLSSANSESTGEGATLVKSVATLAGTVIGAVALAGDPAAEPTPQEAAYGATAAELNRYRTAFPEFSRAGGALVAYREQIRGQIFQELGKLAEDVPNVAARRIAAEEVVSRRLAPHLRHYATWRASLRRTIEESFQLRIPLQALESQLGSLGDGPTPAEIYLRPSSQEELWRTYGVAVTACWPRDRSADASNASGSTTQVISRVPDLLELTVHEQRNGLTVVTGISRHLVADNHSRHELHDIPRSWFGKRTTNLSFSAEGFLTEITMTTSAGLAAGLQSLANAPADLATGITGSTAIFTATDAARRAGATAQLGRVKQEIELRQQEALGRGLDATDADAARLQRLQQLQAVLDAQAKISGADPRLVAALNAPGELDWYERPKPAAPAEPQTIRVVIESAFGAGAGAAPDAGHPAEPDPDVALG
ncbi:MAG: hypothetical protein ABJA16_02215 [Nakamurella sp.]